MSTADVPCVTAEEARKRLVAGGVLIDVREADEWLAGHDPAARHIPLAEVLTHLGELPSDLDVLVICRSGNRSRAVTEALRARGIEAWNVEGGMRAWQEAGGDVLRADGTPGTVI